MRELFWTTVGRRFEREPVEKRLTWRDRAVRVALLALALVAAWAAYEAPRTPALQVRHVAVEGESRLSEAEVIQVAGVAGVPRWSVGARDAEARLEALPAVAGATVHHAFLADAVRIEIDERAPRAVWRDATGLYLVADEGVVLDALEASEPGLPVVDVTSPRGGAAPEDGEASEPRPLRPGDRVDGELIAFARVLYAELPEDLRDEVERIAYGPELGYELVAREWRALLGDPEHAGVKARVLQRVLEEPGARYVDVSSPTTPYYRKSVVGGR